MPSVATSVLAEVLKEYKANYPDVTLRILEGYSGSLMDSLASGKVDIAVVNNMGSLGGVAVIPLLHDHLVRVSRWQSGKRVPAEIPARKLAEQRLVLPSQRQGMRLLIDSMLASSGIVLRPEVEIDALATVIELVRISDWVTILPVIAVKRGVDQKQLQDRATRDAA